MRAIISFIMISFFYNNPIVQTTIVVFLSICNLTFILVHKPPKKKINYYQLVSMEIIIIIVNLCVFILAIMDRNERGMTPEDSGWGFREALGDMIIACSVAFTLIGILFVIIKLVIGLRAAWKVRKTHNWKGKRAFLQLLMIPF
mmetsp:Transcript_5609/g.4753  ORF Transcript_5609/g.4753 Transcript_5609/m.4753 type:complete len:144 (+) Transcript_5609:1169-1600(+)